MKKVLPILILIILLVGCTATGYEGTVEEELIMTKDINIGLDNIELPLDRAMLMEVQYLVRELGYGDIEVDGYTGGETEEAILKYQQSNQLEETSKINKETVESLYKYMIGIEKASENEPELNIVNPKIDYSYEVLQRDLIGLKKRYPFIEIGTIGQSELGKELYYIKLGTGEAKLSYNAAHHAREWLTSPLVMKFAEEYIEAYSKGEEIEGHNIAELWEESSLYIVPMLNPDGVNLAINGLLGDEEYFNQVLEMNYGKWYTKNWKANINGVDLNRNYDVGWEKAKAISDAKGYSEPGTMLYIGEHPESESEVKSMVDFTRTNRFEIVIAYHTQGEIIYADYDNYMPKYGEEIANIYSGLTGYPIVGSNSSDAFGGYKDWVINELDSVGMTVEIAKGEYPLATEQFYKVYKENKIPMMECIVQAIKIKKISNK